MAFFLLMWLTTDSSQAERTAIAAFFTGAEVSLTNQQSEMPYIELEASLLSAIQNNPALTDLKEHIQFHVEPSGLRINLTDASSESLFASGAENLSDTGIKLIGDIGEFITPLPFNIHIEGHTDAFKTAPGHQTNWQISTARANNTLVILEKAGIPSNRFKSVTGLADTRPLLPNQPHAPVNRRISILLELSR
jgi:chemotaxis protein MotB